jgi:hypothetical protein
MRYGSLILARIAQNHLAPGKKYLKIKGYFTKRLYDSNKCVTFELSKRLKLHLL